MRRLAPALGALSILATAFAAQADGPVMTSAEAQVGGDAISLERIMADPSWIGHAPRNPYWSDRGDAVYYTRQRSESPVFDLWRVDVGDGASNGTPLLVAEVDLGLASHDGGHWSRDRQRKIFTREGDLFLFEAAGGSVRQLTRTTDVERGARFVADERRVSFQRGDRIVVRDLESGLESHPADLRLEDDPEDDDEKSFLHEQQTRLFEVVRRRAADEEALEAQTESRRAADPTRPPAPIYLGDDVEIEMRRLSPDGGWMLLVVSKGKRDRGQRDQMAEFVNEDGFVSARELRAKVGVADPIDHQLWLVDLEKGEHHVIDLAALPGLADDPLAELRAAAEARAAATDEDDGAKAAEPEDAKTSRRGKKAKKAKKGRRSEEAAATATDAASPKPKPRPLEIEAIRFTRDGQLAAVQFHTYDNKDRWIALIEPGERTLTPIHRLHDEAWINWSFNEMAWIDGPREAAPRLWFLSEESGWSQLYVYDHADGATRRLTHGDFVVSNVEADLDGGFLYYQANPDHPGIYDVYRVPTAADGLASGDVAVEQLTDLGGVSRGRISPDGQRLLIHHSTTTQPPELYLQDARPGAEARRLTETVSEAFEAISWTAPEVVSVPSSHHDRPIHARLYQPEAAAPGRGPDGRRPAVFFVHGAGYLQNAHHGWSGYFREFMFHSLLTRAGYVVLDMDYRASRGYGRDWRTAIYRDMGRPEVEDLGDGVAWLREHHGVDPARVGVYGGSYGGFLTFMALFTEPDLFACGAALRPVSDWAHYNHPYTSNILNTPDIDPEAYARSSPIEHAAGLEKPLLICSPMVDDNVFFQDSVRLVQRLIELGKTGFETAIYPVEPHGFRQPSSWLDEYRRIFALFETHLAP